MVGRTTEFAKTIFEMYINENSVCIDATMGNGNDTYFLSERCKKVYSFDVQQKALDETKKKLTKNNVELILSGHENVLEHVKENVDFVVYNLGYLPKSDESVITKKHTTIKSIKDILEKLIVKGTIVITSYYGHDGGMDEKDAVEQYLETLNSKVYAVMKMDLINRQNNPPIIYVVEKKG